jgi:hypothetical protein
VGHCLIGAAALAAHGVSRSTLDIDLLAVDPRTLDEITWARLRTEGVGVEIRRGDSADPLAGIVRLSAPPDRPVDVVVGCSAWQREIIERARPLRLADSEVAVAQAADVVALKLFAGGPQDLWDIEQLLGAPDGADLAAVVETRLVELPDDCQAAWHRLRERR